LFLLLSYEVKRSKKEKRKMDSATLIFIIIGSLGLLTLIVERTFNYMMKMKVSDCCGSHIELSHSGSVQQIKPMGQILGETLTGMSNAASQINEMKKNIDGLVTT